MSTVYYKLLLQDIVEFVPQNISGEVNNRCLTQRNVYKLLYIHVHVHIYSPLIIELAVRHLKHLQVEPYF